MAPTGASGSRGVVGARGRERMRGQGRGGVGRGGVRESSAVRRREQEERDRRIAERRARMLERQERGKRRDIWK